MKFLVTGGSGLIGSALKKLVESYKDSSKLEYVKNKVSSSDYTPDEFNTFNELLTPTEWVFLTSKDCNLLNMDEVYACFEEHKPKFIIHLAAEVGGLFKNMNEKVKMFENNLLMNFNVLKAAHQLGIHRVMCCLSTCIFPDKVEYPISESALHNGPPHNSNYAYAYAKRMLDIHCRVYREQFNRNYFCVVPTNVYGPNDNYDLQDGHVIPALIHQCYLAKQNNTPFYVKGSGTPLRQFIYSEDIARCIYHIAWGIGGLRGKDSVILSVGEKEEVSIGDVAKLIASAFEYDNIVFQPEFPDGQYKKTVNNQYLLSILPKKFQFIPIDEGIKQSVQWFIENYTNARL